MNIKDKVIVITGASGGIGQATSLSLHQRQAKLILVARNAEKLKDLNRQMNDQHQIVAADLSTQSGRQKLLSYCESVGHIDMLINNAGISDFVEFERNSDEKINELININLVSPMLLTKALLPTLAKAKESIILNVGSSFGTIGYPCFTTYCASKFGLKGFSESLKRELQDQTTKVLYMAPRATKTSINTTAVEQLNKQLGNTVDSPQIVAKAIIEQLVKESDRVAIGWPEKLFLKINGLFPSLVDGAIAKQLQHIKNFARLNVSVDSVIEFPKSHVNENSDSERGNLSSIN